jgi:hypothetical protein
MAQRQTKPAIKPAYTPDADEAEALAAAAVTLRSLTGCQNPEAVASAVISRWIIERMKRCAGARLADTVVFDLGDAKLRGMIEAALPQIGGAIAEAGVESDAAFFDLPRDQVLNVFVAACIGYREAAVAAGESRDFPFSDPIPFGGPVTDADCTH